MIKKIKELNEKIYSPQGTSQPIGLNYNFSNQSQLKNLQNGVSN